jgi:hypothetical protein
MSFRTEPFRIPRYVLIRVAAEEYVRTYWWFVLITPVFGLLAIFSGVYLLQVIGIFAALWPLTIPARAALTGWKSGSFFEKPSSLELVDDELLFHGENGRGMKLSVPSIRAVIERNGFLIVKFGIGEFVAIPLATPGLDIKQLELAANGE